MEFFADEQANLITVSAVTQTRCRGQKGGLDTDGPFLTLILCVLQTSFLLKTLLPWIVATGIAPYQRGRPVVGGCPLLPALPLSSLSSLLTSFPSLSVVSQQPVGGNRTNHPCMKPQYSLLCAQPHQRSPIVLSVSCSYLLLPWSSRCLAVLLCVLIRGVGTG